MFRYIEAKREYQARWRRESNKKLKVEAIEQYGGVCACCKESLLGFLTLDHVIPTREGTDRVGGVLLYRRLKSAGWPLADELRILCWNCNLGRDRNRGQCPHLGLFEPKDRNARRGLRLKVETFQVYGNGTCQCCGEDNIGFLSLDHITPRGRGTKRPGGGLLYAELRRDGWPQKDELRVLCFNCNSGRQFNDGVCPHAG
jgi:5-methylcytosine-specific restriction endonuclease McrA